MIISVELRSTSSSSHRPDHIIIAAPCQGPNKSPRTLDRAPPICDDECMNDALITEIADSLMPDIACDDEHAIEIACDDIDNALIEFAIALNRGDIIMPLIRELIRRGAMIID